MKRIQLHSLTSDPFGPVEELMVALCTFLDNQSKQDDAFVVSLVDTSVTDENIKKVCCVPECLFMFRLFWKKIS